MSESASRPASWETRLSLRTEIRAALLAALEGYAVELGFDQSLWIERLTDCAGQTYDEFAGLKTRLGFESISGLTASSISLVHEDELSLSLELSSLVRKLRETCMPELSVLHRRLLVLFDQEDMPLEGCPVGPDAVARALRALIEAVGLDSGQRQKLLERSVQVLSTGLLALYAKLNQRLDEAGVTPRPISFVAGAERVQTGSAGANGSPRRNALHDEVVGGFAALQERFLRRRQNGMADAVAMDPELAVAIRERVLRWLSERQGVSDAGAMSLAGSELAPLLPARTAVAVEAVEQVFAAIAAFGDVRPVARELIGQLQIPLLRLALVDDQLLADPSHPARVLLDNLASIAVTLPPDDRSQNTLSQLNDIVQGLNRSEASGAEAFVRAQSVLDHLVRDMQRRESALTRESIEGAERAERRETALVTASAIVRDMIVQHTPAAMRNFLERWWVQVLARTIYSHGVDHDSAREAIEVARSLVVGSSVATPADERGASSVLAALKRGLGLLGFDGDACVRLLAPVVGAMAALRSGRMPESARTEVSVAPVLTQISGTRPLPLLHHPGYALIAGGSHPAGSAVVGNWMSLALPDGRLFIGGVTWIGPEKKVLLMVDGTRSTTLAVSRRAIVDLANQGRCQLIDRSSITDRAVVCLLRAGVR